MFGLQSAIGLEITKYDRAELQIVIEFGLQSARKILKNELKNTMGLQTATDYKVIQYNHQIVVDKLKNYVNNILQNFLVLIDKMFPKKKNHSSLNTIRGYMPKLDNSIFIFEYTSFRSSPPDVFL